MVRSVEPSVSHKRLEGFLSLSFSSNAPSAIFFYQTPRGLHERCRGPLFVLTENEGVLSLRTEVRCH